MDNKLTLFWNIASQPARAVKALLEIGKIPHEQVNIDLPKLISRHPDTKPFVQLNGIGHIPTIKDGELVLTESGAIMIYLSEKYCDSVPVTFYPTNLVKRSIINQYISWYQSSFRPAFMQIIKFKVYGKLHNNENFTLENISNAQIHMQQQLCVLEQILRRNGKYIVGDTITIPDLLLYFEITNYKLYDKSWEHHKLVAEWFKLMYSIPEVKSITHQWAAGVPEFKKLLGQIQPSSGSKL